jgi:hypothetical protein
VEEQEALKGKECLGCWWRIVTAGCVSHVENEEVGHLGRIRIEQLGVSRTLVADAIAQRIAFVMSTAVKGGWATVVPVHMSV